MPTVYTEVEVDVSLDEFETEDLVEELERRGEWSTDRDDYQALVNEMYDAYRANKHDQVDRMLQELFYSSIGRIA